MWSERRVLVTNARGARKGGYVREKGLPAHLCWDTTECWNRGRRSYCCASEDARRERWSKLLGCYNIWYGHEHRSLSRPGFVIHDDAPAVLFGALIRLIVVSDKRVVQQHTHSVVLPKTGIWEGEIRNLFSRRSFHEFWKCSRLLSRPTASTKEGIQWLSFPVKSSSASLDLKRRQRGGSRDEREPLRFHFESYLFGGLGTCRLRRP